jgi:HAD superfamily hydrolase (TIGR01549 family)
MYNSLKKHLSYPTIDFNELMFKWGYEMHRLFMEYREKNFIDTIEMEVQGLKNILREYKINISNKLVQTIVEDVWQDFIKNNKLCPDAILVLNLLKQSGYKLGLITDSESNIVDGILQKHGLTGFFDVKVISGEIKAYKPNSLLFREAVNLAKCKPREGMYIGDSEIDIKGAAEVGLVTVIVDRSEIPDHGIGIRPDFRIGNLSKLPEIVSEIDFGEE